MFSVSCVLPRDDWFTFKRKLHAHHTLLYFYLYVSPILIQMAAHNARWLCLAFSQCILQTVPYPSLSSFFVPL